MNEEEEEQLKQIVNDLNRDVEMPPYDNSSRSGYSREYQEYREEEVHEREKTRYEELCLWFGGLLSLKAGEKTHDKLSSPLRLLKWEITPGMVLSAAVGVGFFSFLAWFFVFVVNFLLGPLIPVSLLLMTGVVPLVAGAYTYYKPVYAAKNKVIRSSGEMILSILYMVVYMRSSPNLEGAVRFAALNLDGPIAKDLRGVLWEVEIGNYSSVDAALEEYTRVWKDYNDDFLQSLQLLKAAMNEPNDSRRESMLQDSIDTILEGTREKMKHYAQSLKTPVMILNALGAMLPVMAMIMLPLITVFLGGVVTPLHLVIMFNVMLPIVLYWLMQRLLTSRPPTTSSTPVNEDVLPPRGRYRIEILEKQLDIPTWPIGVFIFLFFGLYGFLGYWSFPHMYPVADPSQLGNVPAIFGSANSLSPIPMLMRSVSITFGLGIGIGVSKMLGNKKRKLAEEEIEKIEQQFPDALFQLGNKISGGTPVEVALEKAAESTSEMEISQLFRKASSNVRQVGMTFEQAIFDPNYGAIQNFPSRMIHTVMKAVVESSEKGTEMAAVAMLTISRYMQNIHQTQERLNDLLEETTSSIELLAYLLAPVVSGVAVGMSQTIITAMFELSSTFQESGTQLPQSGAAGGTGASSLGGILGGLDNAIPPELLQLVVGVYLIQLLYILGTFYMKITKGENQTYKHLFIGKVLISGMFFYTLVLVAVSLMFGGLVGQVAGATG